MFSYFQKFVLICKVDVTIIARCIYRPLFSLIAFAFTVMSVNIIEVATRIPFMRCLHNAGLVACINEKCAHTCAIAVLHHASSKQCIVRCWRAIDMSAGLCYRATSALTIDHLRRFQKRNTFSVYRADWQFYTY